MVEKYNQMRFTKRNNHNQSMKKKKNVRDPASKIFYFRCATVIFARLLITIFSDKIKQQ